MKKTREGIRELIGQQKKYRNSISAVRANSSSPLVNNPSKIANIMNFLFASCGHQLAAKLLHSNKSYGLYLYPIRVLKCSREIRGEPLAIIFNTSIGSGTFPTKLKVAKVIPIFKAGDATAPNNYRPISLLSI